MNIQKQGFLEAVQSAVDAPNKSGSKWDMLERLFFDSGLRGNGAINNGAGADRTSRIRQLATSKQHSGHVIRGVANHSVFVIGGDSIAVFNEDRHHYVSQIVDALNLEHPDYETCIVMIAEQNKTVQPVCLIKRFDRPSEIGYESWWPGIEIILTPPRNVAMEDKGDYNTGVVGCNTIFFGPPGTGKSTEVKRKVGSGYVLRTQFHPEYSHSDLIGSYRPVVGHESIATDCIIGHDGKTINRPVNYFSFVPGPFTLALEHAFNSKNHVYLVIEEINRGDCAAIFGDIFQLLDRDDAGKSEFGITPKSELLSYLKAKNIDYDITGDERLYLPPNLSIFATMNTSDQSLYPMDAAFKRRWQWVSCPIDLSQLLSSTGGLRPYINDGKVKWDWIKMLELINQNIVQCSSEDKQVGPWFIKPDTNGEVPIDSFLNKCLFYLWNDAFKDEQQSDLSPFKSDGFAVFGDVQANIRNNGLAAGFKEKFLVRIDMEQKVSIDGEPSQPT